MLMPDGLVADARNLAPAFSDSDVHVLVCCMRRRGVQCLDALANAPASAMRALMRDASQKEVELLERAAQSAAAQEWKRRRSLTPISQCSRSHGRPLGITPAPGFSRCALPRSRSPARRGCPVQRAIDMTFAFSRAPTVECGPRAAVAARGRWQAIQPVPPPWWCEMERARAILQPCAASLPSLRSGLRCWKYFCLRVLNHAHVQLPPSADDVAAWSALFRCQGSFQNYLCHLKVGCLLVGADTGVFSSALVSRAKSAVRARRDFVPREKLFLQHDVVRRLVRASADAAAARSYSMLYLFAYCFLLRTPSEALPVVTLADKAQSHTFHSAVYCADEEITLYLRRRKNRPGGSVLTRRCWCAEHRDTCPVHVLGAFFKGQRPGEKAFHGITAALALQELRSMLHALGIQNANSYRTHDLRRGHAKDLQLSNAPLSVILRAGEWRCTDPTIGCALRSARARLRSCAFLAYLDEHELERDATVEVSNRPSPHRNGGSMRHAQGTPCGI